MNPDCTNTNFPMENSVQFNKSVTLYLSRKEQFSSIKAHEYDKLKTTGINSKTMV